SLISQLKVKLLEGTEQGEAVGVVGGDCGLPVGYKRLQRVLDWLERRLRAVAEERAEQVVSEFDEELGRACAGQAEVLPQLAHVALHVKEATLDAELALKEERGELKQQVWIVGGLLRGGGGGGGECKRKPHKKSCQPRTESSTRCLRDALRG